jgi:hypothetical protein
VAACELYIATLGASVKRGFTPSRYFFCVARKIIRREQRHGQRDRRRDRASAALQAAVVLSAKPQHTRHARGAEAEPQSRGSEVGGGHAARAVKPPPLEKYSATA